MLGAFFRLNVSDSYVFKLSRPVIWSGSYDLSDPAPVPKMDRLGVDAQSLLKVLLDSQNTNDEQSNFSHSVGSNRSEAIASCGCKCRH